MQFNPPVVVLAFNLVDMQPLEDKAVANDKQEQQVLVRNQHQMQASDKATAPSLPATSLQLSSQSSPIL